MTRIATEKNKKDFFYKNQLLYLQHKSFFDLLQPRNCTAIALTQIFNFNFFHMTKKKIINFLIEVAKLAIAFFAGNQVTNL